VEKIVDCNIPDIKPSVKKKLTSFVKTIRDLRDLEKEVFTFLFLYLTPSSFSYSRKLRHPR